MASQTQIVISSDSDAPRSPPAKRAREAVVDEGSGRSKRWTWTINNPEPQDFPTFDGGTMLYMVYQQEIGGDLATPHLQGYVRYEKRKDFRYVRKRFPRAHIEISKGTEAQNRVYCTKPPEAVGGRCAGTPIFEFGEFKGEEGKQGKRSDLTDIAQKLMAGATLRVVATEHPGSFIRYHSGITALQLQVAPDPPLRRDVTVKVYWGASNTGKTHRCRTTYPDLYAVAPGRAPWDGYRGQETILFDEFNPDRWEITEMNRYLDVWRCQLDCRYYNRYAAWTRVLICANTSPLSWYNNVEGPLQEALRRRLTTCLLLPTPTADLPLEAIRNLSDDELEHTPQFN